MEKTKIIEVLENCGKTRGWCEKCVYSKHELCRKYLYEDILDLIKTETESCPQNHI
jgi:hypothetical protein